MSGFRFPDTGVTRVGPYWVETYRGFRLQGHHFNVRTAAGESLAHGDVSVRRSFDDAIERALVRLDETNP